MDKDKNRGESPAGIQQKRLSWVRALIRQGEVDRWTGLQHVQGADPRGGVSVRRGRRESKLTSCSGPECQMQSGRTPTSGKSGAGWGGVGGDGIK